MVTAPPRPPASAPIDDLEALIEEARRRARRRRAWYGALALTALALATGAFFLIGHGGGGPPGVRNSSGDGPGAGPLGLHGPGGSNAKEIRLVPGPVRFLRTVTLPPSDAPAVVRQAFAARRYSAAAPREAARLRSSRGPLVLWASPAYGGGWCEGLQQPRFRFNRLSVSCIWPQSWMRRRIPVSIMGAGFQMLSGRVPQNDVRELRLRLGDGNSLSVPSQDGFFLFRVPDRVLVHTAPRALLAYGGPGRVIAREKFPAPLFAQTRFFGGIQRPPGGAELAHKDELLARITPAGRASIWAAPSFAAPARCTWLQVGRAVYGGGCRRYQPPRRGLSEIVPLRARIKGRVLNLLWGQVGRDVADLVVRFQNGSEASLPVAKGVFLYPVPGSHWKVGHRPAFLIARDMQGRTVGKRPLFEYTLAH